MSRSVGIAAPVFTLRAVKARSPVRLKPEVARLLSRHLRELRFDASREFWRNYAATLVCAKAGTCVAKRSSQAHELRMLGAPVAGEAQVAVTEEAGHGDLLDVRNGIERRRIGFESFDGARDLGVLIVEPFLRRGARRPEAAFIEHQDLRVGRAVGERLQPQRAAKRAAGSWG